MIETGIIGALLGGLFRLAPEIIKMFKSKDEMKHELEMFRLQTELEKTRGDFKVEEKYIDYSTAGLEAIVEANKAEAALAKNNYKWVNAIISLMRPYIAFTVFNMYVVSKAILLSYALSTSIPLNMIVEQLWTENDVGILMMIISFYFVNRSIEKYERK